MNKKDILLAVLAFVIAVSGLAIYLLVQKWNSEREVVIKRCIDYNAQWLGMIDCYGVISVWQPDDSGYLVGNNKRPGSIIAQIRTADNFIVRNDQMYLIDITPKGKCGDSTPEKYCGDFQVKGELKTYYYDDPDQVPTYRIINTKTGDERFYVQLNEIPDADREIFQELLNRDL